jgi:hypothetical protein
MSFDEPMTESDHVPDSHEGNAKGFNAASVPIALVREVASELKSLAKVMPYEEYARVVYRIARVRQHCQRAASDSSRRPTAHTGRTPNER